MENVSPLIIKKIMRIIPVILLAASMAGASQDQTEVRRYLLSAGANNGGRERVLLRYAVSDAKAFAAVLTEMGGIDKNGAVILSNPSGRELLGGISALNKLVTENRAEAPDVRNEVFVYYSGHADRDGIKLGGETLSWASFRSAVNGIDADVRVAVIDACGSGAITRTKGGAAYPAFMSDASSNMRGYAFLTSSNENETSQECDRLRGSFFTHALLNGMRGAADLTGDGRVTINEAYQYAFNETLQNTRNTTAGTQHPSRDMNLAGTGDIVMTDLRGTSAVLSLSSDIEGRFFISDEKDNLFAELRKSGGRNIELGVPPGRYSVQMEALSQKWAANNVVVSDGQKTTLAMSDMRAVNRSRRTVSRGDGNSGGAPYSLSASILCLSLAYGDGNGTHIFPAARGFGKGQFGLINMADEIDIFQAGLINAANGAGRVQAGAVNIAGGAGLQIGIVNAGLETKRQIGLVNIAKQSGKTPIGLISVVGNGIYDVTTYADAAGDFSTSIRTGTPAFYNLIEYSSTTHKYRTEGPRYIGYGLGTRFGMKGRFTANLDFVWQSIGSKHERITYSGNNKTLTGSVNDGGDPGEPPDNSSDPGFINNNTVKDNSSTAGSRNKLSPPQVDISYNVRFQDYFKLRLGTNYNPHKLIAVTGGISLNAILDSYTDNIEHRPNGGFYRDREFRDFNMRFWPGVYAGLTVGKVR